MRSPLKKCAALFCSLILLMTGSCLPQSPGGAGEVEIKLYGFSIMREPLEQAILPAFIERWRREHNQEIHFVSSYAGSETITNQILQGVSADIAVLSIERDAERLRDGGALTSDWRALPHQGIINRTPFVILVRRGNPKNIRDFADLARAGVRVIHPDPVSSGGAQWSVLAIYGSEIVKSEAQTGRRDEARALRLLQNIWRNVISTPGSAREARTQFELGQGDALVTYELEGLMMRGAGATVEIIYPEATIFSEHPAVVVDRNVTQAERAAIEAFMQYLWSEEAQRAFVRFHFRSVTDEALNTEHSEFGQIRRPFTIELFGGWPRAYPEIIERVWRDRVQRRR